MLICLDIDFNQTGPASRFFDVSVARHLPIGHGVYTYLSISKGQPGKKGSDLQVC